MAPIMPWLLGRGRRSMPWLLGTGRRRTCAPSAADEVERCSCHPSHAGRGVLLPAACAVAALETPRAGSGEYSEILLSLQFVHVCRLRRLERGAQVPPSPMPHSSGQVPPSLAGRRLKRPSSRKGRGARAAADLPQLLGLPRDQRMGFDMPQTTPAG
jgi:hypothetical protein